MITTIAISSVTIIGMIVAVLVKPYFNIKKIKVGLYYLIPLFGAIILLICNCVTFDDIFFAFTSSSKVNPLKILILFLSMTTISLFLSEGGFFDYIANKIISCNIKSQISLFIRIYIVAGILTVFTSNDIIILTFTPIICIFCKKLNINPFPFLLGEFISANTWSMMLIIGNPTNIYLGLSANVSFTDYFLNMALPTVIGGVVALAVLIIIFRKSLFSPLPKNLSVVSDKELDKVRVCVSVIALILTIIFLAVSDFIGLPMWLISFAFALLLIIFNLIYDLIKKDKKGVLNALSGEPFEIIPFVISMFVIVLALSNSGVLEKISEFLVSTNKWSTLSFGFISAISANLLNNIPMSVLFEKIANGNIYAVYGCIIGSNLGAYISFVGALAGIMWNRILSSFNNKVKFFKFFVYGGTVSVCTILATTLTLLLFI